VRRLKNSRRRADTGAMHTAYYFTPTASADSVDEFLASCRALPEVASHHLAEGWFEPWLNDRGRDDLARRAAKVRAERDGLLLFLKTARPSRRPAARKAA
jgi:hypothetical protein